MSYVGFAFHSLT